MSLGSKVRDFRKQRGMTLHELAEKIKISYSFLSAIERDLKKPSIQTIKKISETLNIPLTYLLTDKADDAALREKLRLIREGRSLGFDELAELSGIPAEQLRAYEEGEERPDLDTLEKLADALGVTVRYFLEHSEGSTSLGARLRRVREAQGMTIVELAAKANVSPSLISQIENDQIVPSLQCLEEIANKLGMTVCYFLLDQEDVKDLLATLSPDVIEMLGDPRVQAVLRAVREFNKGELQFVLNQIEFFKKYRGLL